MAAIRTERGLDRLVNFSDATVAIAITILILPLVDLSSGVNERVSFGQFFTVHYGAFLAFAITFLVIGDFWMIHHRVFEWVVDYSSSIVWLNLLWLASIVFLPFAANVLATIDIEDGGVYAVYIGTMVVTSLSMGLIEVVLSRNPELLREDARGTVDLLRPVVVTAMLLLSLVLAVAFTRVGMYSLLLLFLARPITSGIRAIGRKGET